MPRGGRRNRPRASQEPPPPLMLGRRRTVPRTLAWLGCGGPPTRPVRLSGTVYFHKAGFDACDAFRQRWMVAGWTLKVLATSLMDLPSWTRGDRPKPGGAMGRPVCGDRECGMKWRVVLELVGADGTVGIHEVSGAAAVAEYAPRMIGLTLAEGMQMLAAVQRHLVGAQTEDHCRRRRRCQRCGAQRPLKDQRSRRLVSLFGTVEVRAPRFTPCRCAVTCRRTLSPVAEIMPDRCTPEYERVIAKMGALLPCRRARTLLSEFLPLDTLQTVETTRQRTLRVGARLEQEAVAGTAGSKPAVAAKSIVLSIDGGHVRAARQYQGRSFEVLLAQVRNDEGKQQVFASVPAEATSQTRQLRGVLHGLRATAATPVTILSDGVDGPRSLGEAASPGPTHHVLDWFHLSMRVQHVAQAAKGWPDATESDRQAGARFAETIERIRWRLWHGQVRRAFDLIDETLAAVEDTAADTASLAAAARKVARLLHDLETYVSGQSDIIIDYATSRRREEPISTAITESTVQWLLHRRMNAQQQMRWSPGGAHLMLKVRTAVVNGTLDRDHAVAERWVRRPFRQAA